MKGKRSQNRIRLLGLIVLSLFTFHFSLSYAQMNIVCVGKATQRVNGNDTLFIFASDIELKSKIGAVTWYRTDGTVEATNSEQISPDEGGYYIEQAGTKYSPFYVFKCPPKDISFAITPSCSGTSLSLTGSTKGFTYTRPDGSSGTYARTCTIEYNALVWKGEEWGDSLTTESKKLARTINIDPLYGPTDISICYDSEIRESLELDSACATNTLSENAVIAINFNLLSLATARENDPRGNNELNRPTKQDIITASTTEDYSGALEVAFYSNPTPSVHPIFYRWNIYKASELIAARNDRDIRYVFSEPGIYKVVCNVNSAACTLDSAEMRVNISESYLRVPNVFTPDGNGMNDEFRVAYRSLREFHCWVYNRWGKLVFQWTDPDKGWDGTINGRPAAEGAYFYVIRALGTDAAKNASYSSKASYNRKKKNSDESIVGVYQLSGDINLLRRKK